MTDKYSMRLSIIIVNYNTWDLLCACLESLKPQLTPMDQVIVVDNASPDKSAIKVKEHFPWVTLISNSVNTGFSQANNQGIDIAKGNYIWFLNPDTKILTNALEVALVYMEQNPRIGLAGTALYNPDGSEQPSVEMRYPGQRKASSVLKSLPGEIAWVMGASMVARSEIINAIDGFDEGYPLYGEDLDLCLMIRKKGWLLGFIQDSRIIHYGGQSEVGNTPESVILKKLNAELLFYRKHYPARVVKQIKRKNRLQAAWRLSTLAPLLLMGMKSPRCEAKLRYYRLLWKVFK